MLYSIQSTSELFNLSASTLRNYCEVFADFFSDHAKPPKGKHRSFTKADLTVISLIRKTGDYETALLALKNGQRGELPDEHFEVSIASAPREQVMLLQTRILQLEGENERLKAYEIETVELRAVMRHNQKQLDDLQAKVEKLIAENAVLKSKLDE